jgi:hypothetical protein
LSRPSGKLVSPRVLALPKILMHSMVPGYFGTFIEKIPRDVKDPSLPSSEASAASLPRSAKLSRALSSSELSKIIEVSTFIGRIQLNKPRLIFKKLRKLRG